MMVELTSSSLTRRGKKWVVQVKRRTTAAGESVETVRSLLGVMYGDLKLRGIVVSTADHFTHWADKLAKKNGVVELVDRGKLDLMLSPLLPEAPWRDFQTTFRGPLEDGLSYESVLLELIEHLS
jgi:hypothetical protein